VKLEVDKVIATISRLSFLAHRVCLCCLTLAKTVADTV